MTTERLVISPGKDQLLVGLGNTNILVVTAKGPGIPWKEREKEAIETARGSYRVAWGGVVPWDEYDHLDSTFNYIAYVRYPSPSGEGFVSEAISNRMVLEEPEDLTFYELRGVPLSEALLKGLYLGRGLAPKIIAGESRIGAIRPPNAQSNARTLEAFAAIKILMVQDARNQGVEYIACQLRQEMTANVFGVNGIVYDFPHTEELLGLPVGSIRLNRNNPTVARHICEFPGYFLNTQGIKHIIREFLESGELSEADFKYRTGLSGVDQLSFRNIKELVPLIQGENALGISMRAKLLSVGDGPYSSLSSIEQIERRAKNVLHRIAQYETASIKQVAS